MALVVAFALAAASAIAQSQASKTYNVSDIGQLLKAIGPDRTVVLRKGDYKLSAAYSFTSDYVAWADGDDGKELALSGLKNLTIRGADGARLVSDSSLSSILGIYESSGVTIDNVAFSRSKDAGDDAGAGSLYVESVDGLTIDRCSFEGGTTVAIELWECSGVKIRRAKVSGTTSGAISAYYTDDIESSALSVSGCEGYPLLYFEDCGDASFSDASFKGNAGGNLVEIYASEDEAGAVSFSGCEFSDNEFEYFSGTDNLPSTDKCEFATNSFGEDWAENSVAPASDDEYYDEYAGDEDYEDYEEPATFEHSSGLTFTYPSYWELQEFATKSRAGFFAPFGSTFVLVLTPYQLPAKADPAKQRQKLFDDALAALVKSLKDESSVALSVKADGESFDADGVVSQEYTGTATKGKGERAAARVKLMIYGGGVHALVGMAKDTSSLEVDTDADSVFSSITITE